MMNWNRILFYSAVNSGSRAPLAEPLRWLEASSEDGSALDARVAVGGSCADFVREALRGGHDVIAVEGARGAQHEAARVNVALELVKVSQTPVFVAGPQRRLREPARVLCIVELSESEESAGLNRGLLRTAAALARFLDGELHVLHVHDTTRAGRRLGIAKRQLEELEEARQTRLSLELMALLASEVSALPHVHACLLDGDPVDTVVHFVQTRAVTHVVASSEPEQQGAARARYQLGSLAADVLRRVDCSVVAMRAPRAVSPGDPDITSAA